MPPASIRSNASSRSSTNAPIRHGRRRKKSGSFLRACDFTPLHVDRLVPTPSSSTSRDFVGELPGRNCVAGMKTEERKAGGDLWLNGPTSGECAYVHRRQLLLDRRESDIGFAVEGIENKRDLPSRALPTIVRFVTETRVLSVTKFWRRPPRRFWTRIQRQFRIGEGWHRHCY